MIVGAALHNGGDISGIKIYNSMLFFIGVIAEVAVVSIELLLFHLLEFKYKFLTVAYYIVELLLAVWVNIMIPFAGIVVLTTFSIIKNVFRVFAVERVYKFLGYYELCTKFGIEVKKPRRTRKKAVAVVAKKKTTAKAKTRKPVDATSESYA